MGTNKVNKDNIKFDDNISNVKICLTRKDVIKNFMSKFFSLKLLGWGLWIIIFRPFEKYSSYNSLAKLGDEFAVGLSILIIGTISVILAFSKERGKHISLSFLVSLIGWSYIFFNLSSSNFDSTSTYIYGTLSAMNFYFTWNCITECMLEDEMC